MSRYIDANEAKRQINRATIGRTDVIKVCLDLLYRIDRIPTADVRENVRGYWKKRKDKPLQNWYQCSNCGAICGETPKYCSECGADMRGEA